MNDVKYFKKGQSYCGAFDTTGNVEEWCQDWHAEGERRGENPTGPDEGKKRVTKGGAFPSSIDCMYFSYRNSYEPDYSTCALGFRCVFDLLADEEYMGGRIIIQWDKFRRGGSFTIPKIYVI